MLASRFRMATEDVDIGDIASPWPDWLAEEVARIAKDNDWSVDWLNEAVQVHLSPLAGLSTDHGEFSTFPPGADPGLRVFVPTARHRLALKLKAMRIKDPAKGPQEAEDIRNLIRTVGVAGPDEAIAILAAFFPRSGVDADKQRFFLKHIWPRPETKDGDGPPRYPVPNR